MKAAPANLVSRVEKLWKDHASNEPFEYAFLDESFDELFRSEQRMGTIFTIFAGLAIFVACLGLFALAAFTAEQRTKEIGIRKVMGASVSSLAVMLSREFTKLVLIAFVPAAFAGWYVSNHWLEGFAYRVTINPVIIISSGIVAIIVGVDNRKFPINKGGNFKSDQLITVRIKKAYATSCAIVCGRRNVLHEFDAN